MPLIHKWLRDRKQGRKQVLAFPFIQKLMAEVTAAKPPITHRLKAKHIIYHFLSKYPYIAYLMKFKEHVIQKSRDNVLKFVGYKSSVPAGKSASDYAEQLNPPPLVKDFYVVKGLAIFIFQVVCRKGKASRPNVVKALSVAYSYGFIQHGKPLHTRIKYLRYIYIPQKTPPLNPSIAPKHSDICPVVLVCGGIYKLISCGVKQEKLAVSTQMPHHILPV